MRISKKDLSHGSDKCQVSGGSMIKHFVNALGDICPIPIIKVERVLKKAQANDLIILETDHSCALTSVPNHVKKKYGFESEIKEVNAGIWHITIEKNR